MNKARGNKRALDISIIRNNNLKIKFRISKDIEIFLKSVWDIDKIRNSTDLNDNWGDLKNENIKFYDFNINKLYDKNRHLFSFFSQYINDFGGELIRDDKINIAIFRILNISDGYQIVKLKNYYSEEDLKFLIIEYKKFISEIVKKYIREIEFKCILEFRGVC